MKTKAVRLYGTRDLRLEEFELPAIKDDEILVKVMSDSICMSTYKLAEQGKNHKRAAAHFQGVLFSTTQKYNTFFPANLR